MINASGFDEEGNPVLEEEELYPEIIPIPPNYDKWKGRVRSDWEDMDLGERLTADPTYIDRV